MTTHNILMRPRVNLGVTCDVIDWVSRWFTPPMSGRVHAQRVTRAGADAGSIFRFARRIIAWKVEA